VQHHLPEKEPVNILMNDFRLSSTGELIDPYKILRVSRNAEQSTIKSAYRNLSRKYHPDGPYLVNQKRRFSENSRYRIVWPGSCNGEADVKQHWDRISFAYSVLSNKRLRKKYDRHEAWSEVLNDPGRAIQRATWKAVGHGLAGLWKLTEVATKEMSKLVVDVAKATAASSHENLSKFRYENSGAASLDSFQKSMEQSDIQSWNRGFATVGAFAVAGMHQLLHNTDLVDSLHSAFGHFHHHDMFG
jgi:curved DNA-binding protein CbpA